jgi:hypothetical protein
MTVLGARALNRATLYRQMLLHRHAIGGTEAIARLVGLQAQDPNSPYTGLWSRLEAFEKETLTALLYDRSAGRSSVLRGTRYIVTADDFLWLRPLVQPVLGRARQAAFGGRTRGVDLDELADRARDLLKGRTLTRPRLGRLLNERWPDRDGDALAWSAQALLPLIHEPPSGTWGKRGATPFTLAEEWIGRPLNARPAAEELILRYLAAFGPATVMDVQTWSGLTRLSEVVDELRPRLRVFRDEAGRELFDVPDAPLPDPGVPAPVRLLPSFDNLIVAYADRARLMSDEHRKRVCVGSMVHATVLVDGRVRGTWSLKHVKGAKGDPGTAVLSVAPFTPLDALDRAAVGAEAEALLAFAHPGAVHDLRFTS